MKRLILLLLLTAMPVMAQTTTVTGTIVDPQGNPYASGTVSAIKSVATGQNPGTPVAGTTSIVGTFSITLPSPASYIFTVCASPTQIGPTGNPTPVQVCFTNSIPIAISGGSQDVSSTLNAIAKVLGPNITGVSGVVANCTANQVPFYAVNGNVVACSSVITIAGTTATVQNATVTGALNVSGVATVTGALAANGGATVNSGIVVNGGSTLNGGGSDSGAWTHSGSHTFNGAALTINSNTTATSGQNSLVAFNINNLCFVDGVKYVGLSGINTCNGLWSTTTPGITWIPSNAPATLLWSTPSNGALINDTRFINGPGFVEGAIAGQKFHQVLDFHAGANDTYELGPACCTGPGGLEVSAFADAGGTEGNNGIENVVALAGYVIRSGSSKRPVWWINGGVNYHTENTANFATSAEWDCNNIGTIDDTGQIGGCIRMIAAGGKRTGFGFSVSAGGSGLGFIRGGAIQNYSEIGLFLKAGQTRVADIYTVPPADDTAAAWILSNAANSLVKFQVDDSGNALATSLGDIAANRSVTGFLRLTNISKIAWRDAANGTDHLMGEVQHQRVASCTTGAAANSTCLTTVSWPSAFADANYTPTCTLSNTNQVQAGITRISGVPVAASISVEISNFSVATGATGTINCIGVHD